MQVTIVGGGGGVGSSVAFNLLLADPAIDVVLVDARPEMVDSHVLDLEQVLEQDVSGSVRGGALSDVAESDVVVVATGAPLRVNSSRHDYLADNAATLAPLISELDGLGPGWPGFVLVVTNPVDPLCTWLAGRTGLDRRQLAGYTLNDSLRLRTGIAHALGIAPGGVEAWVLGEHGDESVLLFDRVDVDGERVELTRSQRAAAEDFVRSWYVRHVALDSGRSSTWTSGLGVARMIASIEAGDGALWTGSVLLAGEYAIEGISLGVPVRFGAAGAEVVEWELASADRAGLHRAAEVVRAAAALLG